MKLKDFQVNKYHGEKIIIYGTSIGGKVLYQCLQKLDIPVFCFCDKYCLLKKMYGIPVYSENELKKHSDAIILISLTRSFRSACDLFEILGIKDRVYTAISLIDNKDYKSFTLEEDEYFQCKSFLNQYKDYALQYSMDYVKFPILQVFLTNRCTLRCRYCAHLIPCYHSSFEVPLNSIIASLEILIERNCIIDSLILVGGEPFLYRELYDFLEWCTQHKEYFKEIIIITNGTVLPSEKLLNKIKELNVILRISDYADYSYKLEQLKVKCLEKGIPHFILKESWSDLGRGEKHSYTNERLKDIYANCPMAFDFLLLNGKLYRCSHAAHLQNLGIIHDYKEDYVDLLCSEDNVIEDSLKQFLQLNFLSACQFCNGVDSVHLIIPAEQEK